MIDYLLIHPKIGEHSGEQYIPLGMLKVGSFFEMQGYEVEYWDERCDSYKDLIRLAPQAHYILLSSMDGSQWKHAEDLIELLLGEVLSLHIFVGGRKGINMCQKEGTYQVHDDFVTFVQERFDMQDPITPKTKRFYKIFKPLLFTSYGCECYCTFCTVSGKWTPVPIEQIRKEIRLILRSGHRHISIGDPNIGDADRLRDLAMEFVQYPITWHCNISANNLEEIDEIDWKVLYQSGLRSIEIGVESGSERLQQMVTRKNDDIDFVWFNRNLYYFGNGISPMYSFIVGLPTETREDILQTMDLIDKLSQHPNARFSIYTYCSYPSALQKKYPDVVNFDMAKHPLYWIAGLKFRKDNTRKNFPRMKRLLSIPFEVWSEVAWRARILKFPKKVFEWILKLVKKR